MKKTLIWALVSILLYGVVFALLVLLGDVLFHINRGPWYVYIFEGALFGIVMTGFNYFIEKRKKK